MGVEFDNFNNIKYEVIKNKIQKAKVVSTLGNKNRVKYLDISVSFDTETTSTYINKEKFAFMYVWQFGIDGYYCYGRTWSQFITLCMRLQKFGKLTKDKRLIIFIHNLSYEFQFFRKYFKWVNVFATDKRTPIKALTNLGIEFRDSLILSGYKLSKVAENLTKYKIPKLVGDLDYTKVRNKLTTFTAKEKGYMLNDVRILIAYINEQREQYGNIAKIPLTNTGRVRNLVRKNCFNNKYKNKYNRLMKNLYLTTPLYNELKEAFAGGFTHANPDKVGKKYKNVSSIDFTSSYPTVMISEKYPMTSPHRYTFKNMKEFENDIINDDNTLAIFQVTFTNLNPKILQDAYLSKSKCSMLHNIVESNGRIISADRLTTVITDVDFKILKQVYEWKTIKIGRVVWWGAQYLPKPIIESIIKLYQDKTTLKDVKGKEAEYLHAKGMLNSIYGMSVTDIVRDEVEYTDEWSLTYANQDEQILKYNESKNRFLYYPWGVFVTAYARFNLWSGILSVGDDYIYSDTDSIKMLNYEKHKKYINNYNQEITRKLDNALKFHNLPLNSLKPKTIQGIEKPLGVWDFEGTYNNFKTLGAKRYIYNQGDKLQITVAGLQKKSGANYLLKISKHSMPLVYKMFNDDLSVPKEYSGRMTHTYIDDERQGVIKDFQGNISKEIALSSVHLEQATFTMNIAETFKNLIESMERGEIIINNGNYSEGR